jgi:hypothetical protein
VIHIATILFANPYGITAGQIGVPTGTANLSQGLTKVIPLLLTLVGMLAVVMMIVAGIQMAVSAGNSARFAKARETLLYACVGLIIAIAALAIVDFVAGNIHG